MSPQSLGNARIVAKEAGFSESSGIFILEGRVQGTRSFDDLVSSIREPAKDYAKPVNKEALAYLVFSSGTTGLPKGELFLQSTHVSPRAHHVDVSSRHDIAQEYHVLSDAGLHLWDTKQSGCTGQLSPEPDLPVFTSVTDFRSSSRDLLTSQSH